MDLNPILEVAEELGIPVLHIPTDYNLKFWEVFGKKTPSYPHFKSTVPNESIPETMETKSPLTFSQLIHGIGIPLRAPFYSMQSQEDCEKYRQSRGIEDGERILFFSAGGNGQHLPHPEILANSSTWEIPLRIEVIAGKNREFVAHLQKSLKMKNNNPLILHGKNRYVTIEIVRNPDENMRGTEEEFFVPAEELSKILDISDVSIAKAGGLSTAELLFKGVPIVFDHRVHPFSWELFNIRTVINNGRGYSNFNLYDLEEDLIRALSIPKERSPHFYFEDAAETLCGTIRKQIQDVEIKNLQH